MKNGRSLSNFPAPLRTGAWCLRVIPASAILLAWLSTAAQAQTSIPFFWGELNQLSDNSAAYLINKPDSAIDDFTLDVGDRVRGMFVIGSVENLSTGGVNYPDTTELTGVYDVIVIQKTQIASDPDLYNFVCAPTPVATAWNSLPGPAAAPGTMLRFYEDSAKNYTRLLAKKQVDDGDPDLTGADIGSGPFATEEALLGTATGGTAFWDFGFTGKDGSDNPIPVPGEGCLQSGGDNVLAIRNTPPPTPVAGFNFAFNLTGNHVGIPLGQVASSFPSIFSGETANINGSGSVLGVEGIETPFDFFSNIDAVVNLQPPNLIIEKEPDPDDNPVFAPGGTAYFEITVTNQGPGTTTGVTINDDLPVGEDFGSFEFDWAVASENPDLSVCQVTGTSPSPQHLSCNVGTLLDGGAFTVRVETTVEDTSTITAAPTTTASLAGTDFNATDGNLLLNNREIPASLRPSPIPNFDAKDWETFVGQINCATNKGCVYDRPSGSTDDSYTQGAKEDDENPAIDVGSIPPSKDDLVRWYFQQEFIDQDAFLYLAWVRSNQLGTATIDFELNQSGDTAANEVNPVRTEGDALIVYDFLGGRVDQIDILRWLTAGGGHTAAQCEANNSLPCWGDKEDLLASGLAEGAVNFYDNETNKPGDDGYDVYDPIVDETIGKERFGEAAINLTDAIVTDPTQCIVFAQAFVKSRASGSSFTSELKDFIRPVPVNLSTCVEVPNTAFAQGADAPEVSDDGGFFINAIAGD
jgi:uncharacterized repeat protein (TIGR01451 family)